MPMQTIPKSPARGHSPHNPTSTLASANSTKRLPFLPQSVGIPFSFGQQFCLGTLFSSTSFDRRDQVVQLFHPLNANDK